MGILTERQSEVLALTRKGLTDVQIAETLEVSPSAVYQSKRSALARVIEEEEVKIARRVEMERFDELTSSFWDAALGNRTQKLEDGTEAPIPPCLASADMVLKISDRRAKLMGLNAAEKKEIHNRHSLVGVLKHIASTGENGSGPRSREDLILEAESVVVCEGSLESDTGDMAERHTT